MRATQSKSLRIDHQRILVCHHLGRREALISAFISSTLLVLPSKASLTIKDVTPNLLPPSELSATEAAVVGAYERANPSVVNIFDLNLRIPQRPGGVEGVEQVLGNGSGFFVDGKHIVTCWHVLQSALGSGNVAPGTKVARVLVLNPDGTQSSHIGYLTGEDKARDLAVIEVNLEEQNIQALKFGDSSSLKIGSPALAIGNPFGFDHTLTTGIISALDRGFTSPTGMTILGGLQFSGSLNPGNSGGPLLDLSGTVIGVNAAIYTQTGTNSGIGFAIPSSTVARVVPQLIGHGKVERASLGVDLAPDPTSRALGIEPGAGALIQSVRPGSPAEKAGLLPIRRGFAGIVAGDVIVKMNDKGIKTSFDLAAFLDERTVGEEVDVQVRREGSLQSYKILLSNEE